MSRKRLETTGAVPERDHTVPLSSTTKTRPEPSPAFARKTGRVKWKPGKARSTFQLEPCGVSTALIRAESGTKVRVKIRAVLELVAGAGGVLGAGRGGGVVAGGLACESGAPELPPCEHPTSMRRRTVARRFTPYSEALCCPAGQ